MRRGVGMRPCAGGLSGGPDARAVDRRRRMLLAASGALLVSCPARSIERIRAHHVAIVSPGPLDDIEKWFIEYFAKQRVALRTTLLDCHAFPEDGGTLVAQLHALSPELIYANGDKAARALMTGRRAAGSRRDLDAPIVFTSVADPIAAGLASRDGHAKPGVTGVVDLPPVNVQMKAIASWRTFSTLGFLYEHDDASVRVIMEQLKTAASGVRMQLLAQVLPAGLDGARRTETFAAVADGLRQRGAQLLYAGANIRARPDSLEALGMVSARCGLPLFAAVEQAMQCPQTLFGLFVRTADTGRLAAYKALRILEDDVPPADVPIEAPQRFSLAVNMPAARAMRMYPPLTWLGAAEIND